jgi:IS30 family transposase
MKYTHLSQKERERIYILKTEGLNNKEIGEKLNRNPATIWREIKRNSTNIDRRFNNSPRKKKIYLPDRAQLKYEKRRIKAKEWIFPLKKSWIYEYVHQRLKIGWSPEIISGRIQEELEETISHECIYQFIYSKLGKKRAWWKYLCRGRPKRRKWKGRKSRKGKIIPNRISIKHRPIAAQNRTEFGHFEGDSIVGKNRKASVLHTNVCRFSRITFIKKLKRKTAQNTADAMINIYKKIPEKLRHSCTLDNGSEFCSHEEVTAATGVTIYFAHPYRSWERGTNENTNGLIRRFFPKGTDFDQISEKQIQAVEDWINDRPRKCLGFKTPREVYNQQLSLL